MRLLMGGIDCKQMLSIFHGEFQRHGTLLIAGLCSVDSFFHVGEISLACKL